MRVALRAVIERKDPKLARFVTIPAKAISAWSLGETTTLNVRINAVDIGRRNIKRWDDKRWFIEIPNGTCRLVGVDTGDNVELELSIADAALPAELQAVIDSDPAALRAWQGLSASQQRMLRENVAAAKRPETRLARARRELFSPR